MTLRKNRWLWLSVSGVLLSGLLLLVALGYLGLIVYVGLVNGTPLVELLVELAGPVLVGTTVLVVALAVSGIGLLWVLVQNASLPRSGRVASLVERVEREYGPLRLLGLSDLIAPPEPSADERAERALADLKRQYVDGEIAEAEFERKVDRLVANDSIDEVRAKRERATVLDDGPGSR